MNNRVTNGSRFASCFDDDPPPLVSVEMEYFDKRMALDVIEDAFTALDTSENRAFAAGLCGAFYMCGLLSHAEWRVFLSRIA